jgi:hypothetical protein
MTQQTDLNLIRICTFNSIKGSRHPINVYVNYIILHQYEHFHRSQLFIGDLLILFDPRPWTRSHSPSIHIRPLDHSAMPFRRLELQSVPFNHLAFVLHIFHLSATVRGHTYLFSQSPPLITHLQRHATPGLPVPQCKEWGAPFDGDEDMTLLNALEGFQSTDFSYLSAYHVSARLGEVRRRKSRSPMFEALPPAKRRLLDNSPLDNVIPEVRFY